MRPVARIAFLSSLFLATLGIAAGAASANPNDYAALIATHAAANGIPVELAHAVVRHESNYNPRVTGSAGEIGLMQIKLSTARGLGYRGTRKGLYDPATNIAWGMKYLGEARRLAGGSECGTLSRYNGGLGTTRLIKSYCRQVVAKSKILVASYSVAKGKVRVASHTVAKVKVRTRPVETAAALPQGGNILQVLFASLQ